MNEMFNFVEFQVFINENKLEKMNFPFDFYVSEDSFNLKDLPCVNIEGTFSLFLFP